MTGCALPLVLHKALVALAHLLYQRFDGVIAAIHQRRRREAGAAAAAPLRGAVAAAVEAGAQAAAWAASATQRRYRAHGAQRQRRASSGSGSGPGPTVLEVPPRHSLDHTYEKNEQSSSSPNHPQNRRLLCAGSSPIASPVPPQHATLSMPAQRRAVASRRASTFVRRMSKAIPTLTSDPVPFAAVSNFL